MEDNLASKQRKFSALSFQSNLIQCTPYEPQFLAAFLYLYYTFLTNINS